MLLLEFFGASFQLLLAHSLSESRSSNKGKDEWGEKFRSKRAGKFRVRQLHLKPPTMDDEYILKWRDYQSNFFALAEELYLSESLTDVTLCCKGKFFEAHRLVLSVCSPYFRSLFAQSGHVHANKHPMVVLKDVEPTDMERLLQYMYYGEVKIPNGEIEAFIAAANNLNVRGLSSIASPVAESAAGPEAAQPQPPSTRFLRGHSASPTPSASRSFLGLPQTSAIRTPPPPPPTAPPSAPAPANLVKRKRKSSESASSVEQDVKPRKKGPKDQWRSLYQKSGSSSPSPPLSQAPPTLAEIPRLLTRHHMMLAAAAAHERQVAAVAAAAHSVARAPSPPCEPHNLKVEVVSDDHQAEEDRGGAVGVSPPPMTPQTEKITILPDLATPSSSTSSSFSSSAAAELGSTPRILPPNEPRKAGTCYFCKKAFMKNKQLMNHVCPKKPKAPSSSSSMAIHTK